MMAKVRGLWVFILCGLVGEVQAASLEPTLDDEAQHLAQGQGVWRSHSVLDSRLLPLQRGLPFISLEGSVTNSIGGTMAQILAPSAETDTPLCNKGQDMRCWLLEGMNLECRLCTVHDTDAPWHPCNRSLGLRTEVQCERLQ